MPRSSLLAVAALTLVACGGAAEESGRPPAMPMSEGPAPFSEPAPQEEEAPLEQTVSAYDQPAAPPRLSHVVTLGSQESYAPMPVPGQPAAQQGGPTVVINNNVTGGGYGYGYGGYGYGYGGYAGGYGRGSYGGTTAAANTASHGTGGAWGATGWEGAGRTAAPGHTPNVGGNYAPPPSAGPRTMR